MIPSYLYHYTSVDTLLLVLRNNTIRFNTLKSMNDPIEGHLSKFPEACSYVFASCWTAESREELPMWKLYTDLKGVRFKMPIDLFNTSEKLSVTKCSNSGNFLITSELDKNYIINQENRDLLPVNKVFGPTQVEYNMSKGELESDIVTKNINAKFEMPEINLNLLGQRKLDYWGFEKEFRFRLFFANAIMLAGSQEVLEDNFKNHKITTTYLDVTFNKDSLEGIEVILGPMAKKSEKVIIEKNLRDFGVKKFIVKYSGIEIKF